MRYPAHRPECPCCDPPDHAPHRSTFPVGACVLVDGRDEAIVSQVFPEGSSSFMFPHYRVRLVGGGPEQVAVKMDRISVERKEVPR
jgi:hypothetical protein